MKERPILFSAPMVCAILQDDKTQTRRIVKSARLKVNLPGAIHGDWPIGHRLLAKAGIHSATMNQYGAVSVLIGEALLGVKPDEYEWVSPYGKPGDRLWVRETWWEVPEPSLQQLRDGADTWPKVAYDADESEIDRDHNRSMGWRKRVSIHMPRRFSRIALEIADVRVQRLQDITPEECEAEGIFRHIAKYSRDKVYRSERQDKALRYFRELWCEINGPASWDTNPWVWALTFKRVNA